MVSSSGKCGSCGEVLRLGMDYCEVCQTCSECPAETEFCEKCKCCRDCCRRQGNCAKPVRITSHGAVISGRDWLPGEIESILKAFPTSKLRRTQRDEPAIPELPEEVSTSAAARLLRCSKDTVLKYREAGLLEYRDMAPPGSSRPVFAFSLRSVIELRTTYEKDQPMPRLPVEQQRRRISGQRKYKHLSLDD